MRVRGWSGRPSPGGLEGLLEQRDRPVQLAVGDVGGCQTVPAAERVGVVGAELRLLLLEGRLEQRDGLGDPAGGLVGVREVVAAGERVGVVGARASTPVA